MFDRFLRSALFGVVIAFSIDNQATAQNQCVTLDGAGDYIDCGNAPDLTQSGPVTLECWIRLTAYPSVPVRILSKVEHLGGYFRGFTFHMQSGYIELGFYEVGNTIGYYLPQITLPWSLIPLGTWTHLAGILDATTLTFYVNGGQQALLSFPFTHAPSPNAPFLIGADLNWPSGQPQSFLPGEIDEVRYWSVARSAADIAAGMNVEIDGAPGLIAAWHLNGSAIDTTGNHNGTVHGNGSFITSGAPISTPGYLGTAAIGNIGIGAGGPYDVLFVNGSSGAPTRQVDVGLSSPITIDVTQPPTTTVPSNFVLFGLIGVPGPNDATVLPLSIGTMCFMPYTLNPNYPRGVPGHIELRSRSQFARTRHSRTLELHEADRDSLPVPGDVPRRHFRANKLVRAAGDQRGAAKCPVGSEGSAASEESPPSAAFFVLIG